MPARLAGLVLGIALVAIAVLFGVSLIRLNASADVANVMVAVVTAIGTVEQGRVRRLAATDDPDQRAAILSEDPPEAPARL